MSRNICKNLYWSSFPLAILLAPANNHALQNVTDNRLTFCKKGNDLCQCVTSASESDKMFKIASSSLMACVSCIRSSTASATLIQRFKVHPVFCPTGCVINANKRLTINRLSCLKSGLLDSNQRPRAPQTCALPTALNPVPLIATAKVRQKMEMTKYYGDFFCNLWISEGRMPLRSSLHLIIYVLFQRNCYAPLLYCLL